jgi:hypothetical protein
MTGFFVDVAFGLNILEDRVGTGVFVAVMVGVGVAVSVDAGCTSDPMVFFRYRLRKVVPEGNTKAAMGAIMSSTATRTAITTIILKDFIHFPSVSFPEMSLPVFGHPVTAPVPCGGPARSGPGNPESCTRVR